MRWTLALWLGWAGCGEPPAPVLQPVKVAAREPVAGDEATEESDQPPDAIARLPGEWRRVRAGTPELAPQREADGEDATPVTAVGVYKPALAWQGYNLYNAGHAPAAYLLDMEGRVLHTWRAEFADVFPKAANASDAGTHQWRKVVLDADGALYAIWDGRGIVKLDKDSHVLWAAEDKAHDDVQLLDGGRVAVLARESRVDPRYSRNRPVTDDLIEIRDGRTGDLLQRYSVLDAFSSATDAALAAARKKGSGDMIRTNSIRFLDGSVADKAPAFRKGLVLLSMQYPSALALLDPTTDRLTWTQLGTFRSQHTAGLGPGGELALFDNAGGAERTSRVLLFDPATMEPVWTYEGTRKLPLRSEALGAVQLLPNGNVLITESDGGRAFEVTRDTKETVWEFYSPHRNGDHGDLIAVLFEMQRLPPTLDLLWARSDVPGSAHTPEGAGGAAPPLPPAGAAP